MAKLKIDDAQGKPIVDAYVNFISNLFATDTAFDGFASTNQNQKPEKLQDLVRAGPDGDPNWTVTQQTASGSTEPIDDSNCTIVGDKDRLRTGARSKVTVPLPDYRLTDFGYLAGYAQKIHELYDNGETEKAHKFLLGVMLLARCR